MYRTLLLLLSVLIIPVFAQVNREMERGAERIPAPVFCLNLSESNTTHVITDSVRGRSAFGALNVKSVPEDEAVVSLNGEIKGVTPYQNDKLPSGRYVLKVAKPLFKIVEEQIEIKDGELLRREIRLEEAYSELRITAPECHIYVNGVYVGDDSYSKKVDPGKYRIKAERGPQYIPAEKEVVLADKAVEEVTLAPQIRMGTLSVVVVPAEAADAEIIMYGKKEGSAPLVFPYPVGEHALTLRKENFLDITHKVVLKENEKKQLKLRMTPYAGSRMEIADTWGRAKWWSWGISAAGAAAMGYFYFAKNSSYDKYKAANTTADADTYMSQTKSNEKMFRSSMGVAGAGMAVGVIFLVVQVAYAF